MTLHYTAVMQLLVHPDTGLGPVRHCAAQAARDAAGLVHLSYRLDAVLARLVIPDLKDPVRAHGLWRHTCFEAFIRADGSPGYVEFNFSPSGAWAAYRFSGYRSGMTPFEPATVPAAQWRRTGAHLALDVTVCADAMATGPGAGALRLALAAVIEEQSGTISCWALRHSPGKPDFHHPEGFVLELPGREGADCS